MTNQQTDSIVIMALIAGRKQKNALLTMLAGQSVHLLHTLYGKGSVKASFLKDLLGLVPEENKVVIICMLAREKSDAVLKLLADDFHFNKPNTGIAFTMPIDSLCF